MSGPNDEKSGAPILTPCPFCGETEKLYPERIEPHTCAIICENCSARGPERETEDDEDLEREESDDLAPGQLAAGRAWNERYVSKEQRRLFVMSSIC